MSTPAAPGETPFAPQIHFDDPRYPAWRKVYDVIVNDTPPALREVLKSSAGSLSSALILALYPEPSDAIDFNHIRKVLEAARVVAGEPPITHDPNRDLRQNEVAKLRIAFGELDAAARGGKS